MNSAFEIKSNLKPQHVKQTKTRLAPVALRENAKNPIYLSPILRRPFSHLCVTPLSIV